MNIQQAWRAITFGAVVLLVACGGGGADSDANNTSTLGAISGHVDGDHGATVELRQGSTTISSTTTDLNGNFNFAGVAPGTYQVVPSLGDWVYEPRQADVRADGTQASVQFAVLAEPDAVSDELLAYLDTVTPEVITDDDVILGPVSSTGKSAKRSRAMQTASAGEAKRKEVIEAILAAGKDYACGHDSASCQTTTGHWAFPVDAANPTLRPAQTSLGYVFGSGDTRNRKSNIEGACKQEIVGVDCSHFLGIIVSQVGIELPVSGSGAQSEPIAWKIPPSWGLRLVKVTSGPYQKGDIVYWTPPKKGEAGHIGVAYGDGSDPKVLSSLGSKNDCPKNLRYGPIAFRMATVQRGTPPAWALRLVADEQVAINVQASWKPPFFDFDHYTGSVTTISLGTLTPPVTAGMTLDIQSLGGWTNSIPPGATLRTAAGLFIDASGRPLAPAAGSTAVSAGLAGDCQSSGDPFNNDFLIQATPTRVVVPSGATALQLSVDDCVFWDNFSDASDPLRVKIVTITSQ